jgi:hypothetical protein
VRGRRQRRIAVLLAAALLLFACGEDEADEVEPIPDDNPSAAEDEEPEEPQDPFAIPDEIDEEYVQLVLDELLPMVDRAEQQAVDEAPSTMPPDETIEIFRATYSPAMAVALLTSLSVAVASESSAEELATELEEYGRTRWIVTELGEPTDACVPFHFEYEFTGTETDQTGIGTIVQPEGERDPEGHNPTPWVMGLNGVEGQLDEDLDSICQASAEDDEEMAREQDELEAELEEEA